MDKHHHGQCVHGHTEPMSRRSAARYALKVLLAGGAAAAALMLPASRAMAGPGACEYNGCPCLGFVGGGEVCQNCGHLYTYHAN